MTTRESRTSAIPGLLKSWSTRMSKKKNKNKEIVKASGLDGLAQFRKDLSPQVERPPVAPARVEAEIPPRRRFSANINNQHRAGRAPYNFVPLPEKARAFASPPPHDRFDPYLHSGVIEFDFRAERDFYIRGGW